MRDCSLNRLIYLASDQPRGAFYVYNVLLAVELKKCAPQLRVALYCDGSETEDALVRAFRLRNSVSRRRSIHDFGHYGLVVVNVDGTRENERWLQRLLKHRRNTKQQIVAVVHSLVYHEDALYLRRPRQGLLKLLEGCDCLLFHSPRVSGEWQTLSANKVRYVTMPSWYGSYEPLLQFWAQTNSARLESSRWAYGKSARRTFYLRNHKNLPDRFALLPGYLERYKGIELVSRAWPQILRCSKISAIPLVLAGPYRSPEVTAALNYLRTMPGIYVVSRFLEHDELLFLMQQCAFVLLPYLVTTQSGMLALVESLHKPCLMSDLEEWPKSVLERAAVFRTHSVRSLANAYIRMSRSVKQTCHLDRGRPNTVASELRWDETVTAITRCARDLR
jgi:hypothetical protein